MYEYLLTDVNGNSWGTWIASDKLEAVEMLMDDITNRPDAYMGEPEQLTVTIIH